MEPVTGRVKLSPTMDLHRIENVNVALTHLRSYVPALDIDASEIVARNTKLVLGFVWQLIVRFQILAGEAVSYSIIQLFIIYYLFIVFYCCYFFCN